MSDPDSPVRPSSAKRRHAWLSALVWLLAALPILQIVRFPGISHWDFRVYYSAAMTYERGLDPYDYDQREKVFPAPEMEFFYPPATLHLFRPLASLPYEVASLLWLGFKLSALALLLLVWHRKFEPLNPRFPMVLFFLLAFSSALYRDLTTGNITIPEQLVLWLGFSFLLDRRYLAFALCVAIAAQFKLQPVVFLGLLLFVDGRPRWLEAGAGLAGFLGLFSLNFLLEPGLTRSFLSRISTMEGNLDERGPFNPSLLAFVQDGIDLAFKGLHGLVPHVDRMIYAAAVLGVAALCCHRLRADREGRPAPDAKTLVYVACLAFCVVVPRMKDYAYVICLIPALAILRRQKELLAPVAAFLVLAPSLSSYVLFPMIGRFDAFSRFLYAYLPLLAAGAMLWLYLEELRRDPIR